MSHEPDRSDRLQAAIEALAAGRPRAEVLASLPPELRAMAETGALLTRAGRIESEGPAAAFVLGLEDQLRTDLRLMPRGSTAATMGSGLVARLLLGLATLSLIGVMLVDSARDALPGQPLYGLKRQVEQARIGLAREPATAAGLLLDAGWRRLLEAERLVEAGEPEPERIDRLLQDLEGCYDEALAMVDRSAPTRLVLRADSEAEAVSRRLQRLGAVAPVELGPRIEAARRQLSEARLRLAATTPIEPMPASGRSVVTPSPEPGGPDASATPSASPAASATPERLPATAAVPIPSATAAPAPSATPLPPATSSPAPEPSSTSPPPPGATRRPPTRSPERTATPLPTAQPTSTPASIGPPAASPTWTSEPRWPTDPPEPKPPAEPSPTAPPPGPGPTSGPEPTSVAPEPPPGLAPGGTG